MEPLRLLVVEDDAWTRSLLAAALESRGVEVVAHVGDAAHAMRVVATRIVDLVLVDLDLGQGPTGVDLVRALQRKHPRIRCVLLTSYASPRLFRSNLPDLPRTVMSLRKSEVSDVDTLLATLHAVAADEGQSTRTELEIPDVLLETLRLVAAGRTNAQIALDRGVSEKAVEQAIARLIRVLDIHPEDGGNPRVLLTRHYLRLVGQVHAAE